MKVALITDGIFPYMFGGMPKLAYYLSRHFALLGVDLTVVHCVNQGEKLITNEELNFHLFPNNEARVDSICIAFPSLSGFPGHYLVESRRYADSAYEVLKDKIESFDIIYAKGFTGLRFIEERKRNKKLPPVAVQLHGLEMFQKTFDWKSKLKALLLRPITRECLVNADVVFSYDGYIRKKHIELGVKPENIIIQYGCVPQERLKDTIQKTTLPLKFLYIARDERRKGIPELHRVIQNLVNKYDFELYVVGKIDEKIQVKHPNVHYIGLINNENDYYKVFKDKDILLFSSISDGFPTVIIEAMSQGLTVLATDVGAVSSSVNEETGWLVPLDFKVYEETMGEILKISPEIIDLKKMKALEKVRKEFVWEEGVKKIILDFDNWLKQNKK